LLEVRLLLESPLGALLPLLNLALQLFNPVLALFELFQKGRILRFCQLLASFASLGVNQVQLSSQVLVLADQPLQGVVKLTVNLKFDGGLVEPCLVQGDQILAVSL